MKLFQRSATALAQMIANGEVSAKEVVSAHIQRIESLDGQLNAMVYKRYDEAMEEANEVDVARATGQPLSPLAGVPITVKECFFLKGSAATLGVKHLAEDISNVDAPLIEDLKNAGAIVLGKTNVPQLMVMHETDNPVFGRTNNPWNLDRAPGGSSGGEAAAVAAGYAPLGLANDMGGSIRFPAHSCGLFGLKPTTGRLTSTGARVCFAGLDAVGGQPGPLARSAADVELMYLLLNQGVLRKDRWLPDAVAMTASQALPLESLKGLRVGYWVDDGYLRPSPAVRRAVLEAAQVFAHHGAVVEEFTPPSGLDIVKLYYGLLSADGASSLRRVLGDSPADPRVRRLIRLGALPAAFRSPISWWLDGSGDKKLASLLVGTGALAAEQYWQLVHKKHQLGNEFFAAWQKSRCDLLLAPVHSLPALKHGKSVDLTTAASYCFLANLFHLPAGTAPVTCVRAEEQDERPESSDSVEIAAKEVDAESKGLPIGVQLLARPWREDLVLLGMKMLETALAGTKEYPATPVMHIANPEEGESCSSNPPAGVSLRFSA